MKEYGNRKTTWITVSCIWVLCSFCVGCQSVLPMVQQTTEPLGNTSPQALEIVLTHPLAEGTPEDNAVRAMKSKLQELLGADIKITLYVDNQLGSAQEQLAALRLGRAQIAILPTTTVSRQIEDLKIFSLPYLFSERIEDVLAVLDGSMETEVLGRIDLASKGSSFDVAPITGLGLWFGGYNVFTLYGDDSRSIHSPADFCDRVIAVPDMPLLNAQYQHWGGTTIAADDNALYAILGQRLADGTEVTLQQLESRALYEVQHAVVQAHHSTELYVVIVNATWYQGLPLEVQAAIAEAEQYGKEVLHKTLFQQTPTYLDTICQVEGLSFYTLTEKERDIFRKSVEPLYMEQLAGSPWQIDFVNRVRALYG